MSVDLFYGQDARRRANVIWHCMSARQRAAILWDIPLAQRREEFIRHAGNASVCGIGGSCDILAWAQPTGKGSRTCALHFACAAPMSNMLTEYGREFVGRISSDYDTALATIPMPWRGARAYARALGFERVIVLRRACFLADHDRCVDGELLAMDLRPLALRQGETGNGEKGKPERNKRDDQDAALP